MSFAVDDDGVAAAPVILWSRSCVDAVCLFCGAAPNFRYARCFNALLTRFESAIVHYTLQSRGFLLSAPEVSHTIFSAHHARSVSNTFYKISTGELGVHGCEFQANPGCTTREGSSCCQKEA